MALLLGRRNDGDELFARQTKPGSKRLRINLGWFRMYALWVTGSYGVSPGLIQAQFGLPYWCGISG